MSSGSVANAQISPTSDRMCSNSWLVFPAKSMSIVGRATGALQAASRRAPFRMNRSANGDFASRYRQRSMAKYCVACLDETGVYRL
jgi:hypothetical protein